MRFRLLGRLELEGDGGAVPLAGAVPRAIVARLLLARGEVVRREVLIDDIWEERRTKDPVNALQVQMAKLRAAFAASGEPDRLLFRHGGYQLALSPHDELDVTLLEAAAREGREHLAAGDYRRAERVLRQGLAWWRGPALPDVAGPVFDAERSRLEDLRLIVLEDAAFAALELGRAEDLIAELRTVVSQAPLRERSRARLMLALCRAGMPAEALEVYEAGRRLLRSELGASPSPELRDLHAAILRHDQTVSPPRMAAAAEAEPVPLAAVSRRTSSSTSTRGNLVAPVGSFVGRGADLDALRALIERERLVTVLGPGGVGKTRLAIEQCTLLRPAYDAVWWVDLATADSEGVSAAVTAALGLSDTAAGPGRRPADHVHRIASFLAGHRTLLALDNCEHLLDGVSGLVATLLNACPELTVLATSRSPLWTAGEALYPLAPMIDTEAAELFTARAAMVDPSFAADDDAMIDIRSLCSRLDGLPLALELAAAHVRMLSVREIEERLDDRFALLAKGARTAPDRHRTLRAVLDWSHALLDEPERRLFMQLALNIGGCSLTAAETLAASPTSEAAQILASVEHLVDASLLVPVSTPFGSRVRMLETVREYALARLRESDFAPQAEEHFMSWASGFAREAAAGIASGDQRWWAERITEESANLRAASELMALRFRAAQSLLLEARLGYYWFVSGREAQGIEPLRRSLYAYDTALKQQAVSPGEEAEWAQFYAIAWLVWLSHESGQHTQAADYIRRHEEVWRNTNSSLLKVLGRCYVPLYAMIDGRQDLEQQFRAADAALADTDLNWERIVLHTKWSTYCLRQGDGEGARRHTAEAVAASRAADDRFARAWSLTLGGDADESCGLREGARRLWTEAAATFSDIGARTRWAYAVLRIAFLDLAEGDHSAAEQRLADVRRLATELSAGDLAAAATNLQAILDLQEGRQDEAETGFRSVWESSSVPIERKAIAGLGLAALAAIDSPARPADAQAYLDDVRDLQEKLLEPLTRRAVAALHDNVATSDGKAGTPSIREHLLDGTSVCAALC
jgi:predicted ATPase/DNA-binding SARP family transcriptional activator